MSNLNNGGLTRVLNYIKTWVNGLLSGKSDTSHTHTKSQITDFPSIPSKTSQLTNDSGYLTSHQSLSNYVTLNSAQTITATKTISANLQFSTTYTRGTAPSSSFDKELIDYKDSAGNRIGLFESTVGTDKSSLNAIYAYNTSVASGFSIGYIGIGSKADGSVYTYAPTPAASDNSTQIATTAWVTSKNYITSTVTSLNLRVTDTNSSTQRTNPVIQGNSSNVDYGINSCFGSCSNTIVGAGEGKDSLLSTLAGNADETLYLISDGDIYFHPNAQTFANRKTIILNTSGALTGLSGVSTSNVTVTNNSSNGVLFGSYRVYVG